MRKCTTQYFFLPFLRTFFLFLYYNSPSLPLQKKPNNNERLYRRQHREDWEHLQAVRKQEKRQSVQYATSPLMGGAPLVDAYGQPTMGYAMGPPGQANRPPPLFGTMTDPGGMGLVQYNLQGGFTSPLISPNDQLSPGYMAPSQRSPLLNRARVPYAPPHQTIPGKRHSLAAIHTPYSAGGGQQLSPQLTPPILSGRQRHSLHTLDPHVAAYFASEMGTVPEQPLLSRSRSFTNMDLGFLTGGLGEMDRAALQRARSASDLGQVGVSISPLISAFSGLELPTSPSLAGMNTLPGLGGPLDNVLQQSNFQDYMSGSAASDIGNFNAPLPTLPLQQTPSAPLQATSSFSMMQQQQHQHQLPDLDYSNPNIQPKRAPSLTVSDVNSQMRPITSVSQEIAAILADSHDSEVAALLDLVSKS